MMEKIDCIIRQAQCVRPEGIFTSDVAIGQGIIQEISPHIEIPKGQDVRVINGDGLHLMPGVIDSQVHFREPGLTHKEDLETGSKAALLGGVTTFLEMPNTNPPTTSLQSLKEKIALGKEKSWVDFGFFIGASGANLQELQKAIELSGCCGIKIFLGSSTGDLLLYKKESLEDILTNIPNAIIAVHSENEELLNKNIHLRDQATSVHAHPQWRSVEVALSSTKRIVEIARRCGRGVHILHISTGEEMDFLKDHKDLFTVEVTPQHLTLSAPECYNELGTFAQMNPPIREARHQERLWQALNDGTVDVIGSDHAPHTKEEKQKAYPQSPSGMPGVQTILPVMLSHVDQGRISLENVVKFLCEAPAKLYSLNDRGRLEVGKKADLILLDRRKEVTIQDDQMASRSNWTPFKGLRYRGSLEHVFLAAEEVSRNGKIQGAPSGQPICSN